MATVVKSFPQQMNIEPTSVEVTDINDASAAYDALTQMANAQRQLAPWLSAEQAWAKTFEDPDNAELAARAHRRPAATMSFPMPH